jgi:Domain of Unknown Function (DUF1259)
MSGKKTVFLLPTGLALVVCAIAVVGSISPAVYGQQQQGTTGGQTGSTIDCQTAASTLGGMVIPNPTGVCDVAVPRQGLQVQDSATGATLNNLLVINPLFEFTPATNQATTGGAANQVYGFAEFALMEGELTSAMRMLSNSSWNVVAVHNHVIGESPSMIFAHAIANGDINTLVRDARMILDGLMTQAQSQSGNQTSTTTGGMAGNGTTTGGTGGGTTTGGNTNSSPSANSLTGGTTTGEGATAGGGVGTMGGGGGTSPDPGIGTTNGTGGGGQQQQQQQQQQGGGETGATTTTNGTGGGGEASGGVTATPGGAAGPQVSP